MEKIAQNHKPTPHLTQEERDNLNNPIPNNEIKVVVKHLPRRKILSSDDLIGKFYQTFKEEITQFYINSY